jgi:membrane fusion protein, macrolide-specific efflux system
MKLKVLALVLLLAVGAGAVFVAMGGIASANGDQTRYLTANVTRGTVSQDVTSTGTVAASAGYGLAFGSTPHPVTSSSSSSSSAGSSTTWHVDTVSVKVGDSVKRDAVLAKAATADLQAQYDQASARWQSAKIQLVIAEDQRAAATTTSGIRQSRIAIYNARTSVSQAAQSRTDLAAQIKAATLTAPIDGVVSAVNVTAGFDAPSGDAIVVSSRTYNVTASVVESDLTSVKVGQKVAITVSAVNASLTGTVASVALAPSTTSGSSSVVSYPVTISVDGTNSNLRAGMSANVSITVNQATNVLVVPTSALSGSNGNYAARVLGANNAVSAVPVEVGLVTTSGAEITSGLSEGQTVVTGTVSNTTTTPGTTTNNRGGGLGGGFGGGGFGGGGFTGPGGGGRGQP